MLLKTQPDSEIRSSIGPERNQEQIEIRKEGRKGKLSGFNTHVKLEVNKAGQCSESEPEAKK